VSRELDFYNLDAIIAVGYRVNSYQATQFRIWATNTLKEFILKGFVLDDVGATLAVAQNVNAVAQNRAGASPAPTMETEMT
jgi:hypothetical protein